MLAHTDMNPPVHVIPGSIVGITRLTALSEASIFKSNMSKQNKLLRNYEGTRQHNIYLQQLLDTTTLGLENERQLNQIFAHQIELLKDSVLRGKRKIQHLEEELNTYKRAKSDYDNIQKQVETLTPTTEIMILSKDSK